MYFWRIEKLKTRMAARLLSEREELPYLVVTIALYSAAVCLPQTAQNFWDGLGAAWSVLLAVVGTIHIYRRNGGAAGRHFLQRYFAVGWVVTVRCLVVFILAGVAFYGTLTGMGVDAEDTQWYDFLFFAVVETALYWRIGWHVGDLAQRTAAD
ncbi:MAG: hypothetical protein V4726_09490 [Verrucomicrobiota bacterium]